REKIIDCILDRIDGNISMIITTHYVNEVEKILDKVVFLRDGVIVEQGNVDDLRGKYNDSLDGIYRRIFTE
ncbi:MAG: ABC transporter ATP-binding protein, partial [Clostridium sp.]|nr:ABC transporter ATP-binding protein [Clostridium sp.]